MDVEIVKLSSKGQFVLPLSIRKRFKIGKGEKLLLVEEKGTVILRPVKQISENIEDDIYMMHRAARAWQEIEKGHSKQMSKAAFLKELSTW